MIEDKFFNRHNYELYPMGDGPEMYDSIFDHDGKVKAEIFVQYDSELTRVPRKWKNWAERWKSYV